MTADDPAMGSLLETAVFAQWFHSTETELHYARWKGGEVDIVSCSPLGDVDWAVETKWSDAPVDDPGKIRNLVEFCQRHSLPNPPLVTTRTRSGVKDVRGLAVEFRPAAEYCYNLGRNLLRGRLQEAHPRGRSGKKT